MKNVKNYFITENVNLREAIKTIEHGSSQIALVVESTKLIGTLTDGDIRRWLLKGGDLNESVSNVTFELFYESNINENDVLNITIMNIFIKFRC